MPTLEIITSRGANVGLFAKEERKKEVAN